MHILGASWYHTSYSYQLDANGKPLDEGNPLNHCVERCQTEPLSLDYCMNKKCVSAVSNQNFSY